jgi:solute carrier family 25 carnitine/acylcarnitine transporter 20/29
MSAVPTTLVTAPVERAKVLLQVQGQGGSGPQYKGVFDVMKHLYREGGLRSIFRGTGATIARDGPGSAVYVIQLLRSLRPELKADLQLLCGI